MLHVMCWADVQSACHVISSRGSSSLGDQSPSNVCTCLTALVKLCILYISFISILLFKRYLFVLLPCPSDKRLPRVIPIKQCRNGCLANAFT